MDLAIAEIATALGGETLILRLVALQRENAELRASAEALMARVADLEAKDG